MTHFNIRLIPYFVSLLVLSGCGGGSSNNKVEPPAADPGPTVLNGKLIDSAVIGVDYATATQTGETDSQGVFDYVSDEKIIFTIGNLALPEVNTSTIISPFNYENTENITHPTIVNMARLLQTLDKDSDPSNGLTITQSAKDNAQQVDFTSAIEEFANSEAVIATISNAGQDTAVTTLVSQQTAIAHLHNSLLVNNIQTGVVGSWFIDSTDTLFAIVFFIDGRYAHFEVVPDDLENSGFELGNYKRDQSTGKVTATPLFDENSDYGLSAFKDDNNSGDLLINITSDKATAEIDEDGDGNIDDSVDFVANQNANEIGTWILDEPDMEDGEFMMFTFYSNGTFVEAEIVPDSDDESGMEWGTYAIDNDTNQLTATITFDSNTDAGISDFITTNTPIYIVIDGDTATLSIDEDNDGEADDAVTLNRLK